VSTLVVSVIKKAFINGFVDYIESTKNTQWAAEYFSDVFPQVPGK